MPVIKRTDNPDGMALSVSEELAASMLLDPDVELVDEKPAKKPASKTTAK